MNRWIGVIMMAATAVAADAWAHPPDEHGHHAEVTGDHTGARLWTNAKTGETVRGSFLLARQVDGAMSVSIERDNGDVVVFGLDDLAEADRAEAQRRIEQARAINERLEVAGAEPGAPGRPAQAEPFGFFAPSVKTRWDEQWLYVESDGLPHAPWEYPLMVGIKSWQQQVPLPQNYTGNNAWRIPLKPELADKPVSGRTSLYRGAIALAANGVPIFNALNNRGDDAFKAGELDEYGGHSGRADDYHYHIAPLAIQKVVGKDRPIAYALDGFAIYGLFDPAAKPGAEKACPLGGTEKLDELNGHFGAAPAGAAAGTKGPYHYHASLSYPYINGGMRGRVTVKDDQIDPQPRARPVRQWLQPLRGAAVTGFKALGEKSWSLEYTVGGKKHLVNFRIEGASGRDAKYVFDFVDPDGKKTTETYQARPGREDRDRPERGEGPAREERPVEPGAAPVIKPLKGFALSSVDVTNGSLAVECTCDGKGRSPALTWSGAPAGTKAYAVVMHHVPPDGGTHVYMAIANIPAKGLEGGLKSGDRSVGVWGPNTVNRRNEYAPPCSKGPGDKVYTVTVYALSAEARVQGPLTRDALLAAIKDTTLATATLDVKYARAGTRGGER